MTKHLSPTLKETVENIKSLDPGLFIEAQKHLDNLTKPQGSLGRVEEIAARMIAIHSPEIELPLKKGSYVFAADHGVASEAVSPYPKEVTTQMVLNFLRGGAAINVLSRAHNSEVSVIDVGVDAEFEDAPGLIRRKVRCGSKNMVHEAAMSLEETYAAMEVGLEMATAAKKKGQKLVATGEMGIGNTTPASAITALLTNQPVASVTGRGAGLDNPATQRKVATIESAIAKHFDGQGGPFDPIDVLRCVGGLEIAAIAGFVLGCARQQIAVAVDGFISTSAVAIAYAIEPKVKDYLFAGHCSVEPGHLALLSYIGIEPILSLRMRLGEGTGAVMAMPVIEAAVRVYKEMATFASAGVTSETI